MRRVQQHPRPSNNIKMGFPREWEMESQQNRGIFSSVLVVPPVDDFPGHNLLVQPTGSKKKENSHTEAPEMLDNRSFTSATFSTSRGSA